ncbi:hypothetical protein CALCODRAFT_520588 [Calocera cornea HHB12733]|uniref:Aminoglycoside phosphotransferase domain-containing protein n=1 Tax=Calocera cornea HHB12733 TaxID=1353952 RepID=A0A165DEE7_9BASI|nr:hypothetical protein CALCODRAFT_520588 [Calocera cornea HHB12733]
MEATPTGEAGATMLRHQLAVTVDIILSESYKGIYFGSPVTLEKLSSGFIAELRHFDLLTRISYVGRLLFGVPCTAKPLHITDKNKFFLLKFEVPRRRRIPDELVLQLAVQQSHYHMDRVVAEVSAMIYVREATSGRVPVPMVYGWAMTDKLLGSGFIIMDRISHAVPLENCWEGLSIEAKHRTIRDYARIVHEMSCLTFDQIGSIRLDAHGKFGIGPVQADKFEPPPEARDEAYERRRFNRTFKSASEWLVNLDLEENGHLASWQDFGRATLPADVKWSEAIEASNNLLMELLMAIPHVCQEAEHEIPFSGLEFHVYHPCMNGSSLLIVTEGSNAGDIAGILDWQYAGAYPIWRLPALPTFCVCDPANEFSPQSQVQDCRAIFMAALEEFSGPESTLCLAADARWDILRDLAAAMSLPWYRVQERHVWLENYQHYEEHHGETEDDEMDD